ncbi:MAG: hypothetical protein LBS74_05060 [Oscillospiraceae bacterium]|jgi:hypothetical protein|nr:hypothetical protein [Oscillospiraceae bacterium]
MKKRTKIFILVIVGLLVIKSIHSLLSLVIVPNIQKKQAIERFEENFDDFQNVQAYLKKSDIILTCKKDKKGNVQFEYWYSDPISDERVIHQIEKILCNLDFEYIEHISHTRFAFRDAEGYLQCIECDNDDEPRFSESNEWHDNIIKLKDDWYFRSLWVYFFRNEKDEETDANYKARVAWHIIKGY